MVSSDFDGLIISDITQKKKPNKCQPTCQHCVELVAILFVGTGVRALRQTVAMGVTDVGEGDAATVGAGELCAGVADTTFTQTNKSQTMSTAQTRVELYNVRGAKVVHAPTTSRHTNSSSTVSFIVLGNVSWCKLLHYKNKSNVSGTSIYIYGIYNI